MDWPPDAGIASVDDVRVQRFMQLRAAEPEPLADKISAIKSRTCFAFRVGDERGATWLDRARDCVFMVGMGLRRDIYEQLEYLDQRGELFPDRIDYEDLLFDQAARWRRELRDQHGPELLSAARAEPAVPYQARLGMADVTAVAYPIDSGGWVLQLLVETPLGSRGLSFDQASVIAETAFEHLKVQPFQAWTFLGRRVSPPDYVFDVLLGT